MVLGLSLSAFTLLHTIISLLAIAVGIVVLIGMFGGKKLSGWTALFLFTTILTSLTGFLFPFTKTLPSHITGIISLVVLAVVLFALYGKRLAGAWRRIYVVTAVLALYLNCFVAVVQAFQKLPVLQSLAPTQSEAPFLIAQLVLLLVFAVAGFVATRTFRPGALSA